MAWYKVIFQSEDLFGFESVTFETLEIASKFAKEKTDLSWNSMSGLMIKAGIG